MRDLMPVLAACTAVVCTVPAWAGPGDELFKLIATDGVESDRFGVSVAVSGTTAVIGASYDADNGDFSGSAYIFNAATGQQVVKLLPTDGAASDFFGNSVAISGSIVVVGALADDDNGANSGSAYLFDAITGLQLCKLLPSDGIAGAQFGFSVAISGTTALVGAPGDNQNGDFAGAAYLFDTTTGQQIDKLLPVGGGPSLYFGAAVAMSGSTAIIGAPWEGGFSGSAYLFDTATGVQLFKLLPGGGASFDFFGGAVAISGTTAIAGSALDGDNGSFSGSAYLFDTATGAQTHKLLPDDGAADDHFGGSVAIAGSPSSEIAIIGSPNDGGNGHGTTSGAAYLFDAATGLQITKLIPADGTSFDHIGASVAISGGIAVVGADMDDDNGSDSGSAYLFDSGATPACTADLNGDGVIDFFDLSIFLTLYANGTGNPVPPPAGADFTGDGFLDFFDVSAFLAAFAAGCP